MPKDEAFRLRPPTAGTSKPPQVLDALSEIAFAPQFAAARIEKERKAVLAEAQMMNTIEYRVDCQLLAYLHHENNLGCRCADLSSGSTEGRLPGASCAAQHVQSRPGLWNLSILCSLSLSLCHVRRIMLQQSRASMQSQL